MVSSDERRENGKERKESKEIILANWGDRFLAWLIDFILVSIALAVLFSAIAIPIWFFYYNDEMTAKEHTKMSNLHTTLYQALLSLPIGLDLTSLERTNRKKLDM